MYRPNVIIPPTRYPVTLQEAKERSLVDDTNRDATILLLIAAATAVVENQLGWVFYEQTLEMTRDYWPVYPHDARWDAIELLRATPLLSVTSVEYTDRDGTTATMSASDYYLDTDSTPGRIVLKPGSSWPSATLRPVNGIRIRYIAGHDADQSPEIPFPENRKVAILFLVHQWLDNPDLVLTGTAQTAVELPNTLKLLLAGEGSEAF